MSLSSAWTLLALACACAIATPVPAGAARRDRVAQTVAAQPGRPLHVRLTVGQVVVRAEPRNDLSIEVEREVPDELTPEALPVRIEPEPDAVRVSALQPVGDHDPARSARVTVAAPRDTPVLIEVGEGGAEVAGIHAAMQITVGRGPVRLREVGGIVRAETRSGDIVVERATLPPAGHLRLRTLTGDVRVDLAERPTDARVLLIALSGRVESSLPLETRGGPGRRIKEAVLGSGKALLSIDVVRGDIVLRVP